ncbi:MAG: riboflavin synthase [Nitrospirota bacterium]
MFTGLIEELGIVKLIKKSEEGVRISISARKTLVGLKPGASVAVNGVCLTAATISKTGFCADLLPETIRITNVGDLVVGKQANLERAMHQNDRVMGHLVSGHVEGVGQIEERVVHGNSLAIKISIPASLRKFCILKGSIAVDGVSLTIQSRYRKGISIEIIPHTAKITTLGIKTVGDSVNLETDFIRKYIGHL